MKKMCNSMQGGFFLNLLTFLAFGFIGLAIIAPQEFSSFMDELSSEISSTSSDYASTSSSREESLRMGSYDNDNTPFAGARPNSTSGVSQSDLNNLAELKRDVNYAYSQYIDARNRGATQMGECRWDNRVSDECHWYLRYMEDKKELERYQQGVDFRTGRVR